MPNFILLRRTEVAFFGRFLWRFCGRHYWPLFRKLACEWAEVTSEAHLKPSAFTWFLKYLPREMKLSLRKDFLPSICCTTLKSLLLQQLWQVVLVLYNATTINPTTEQVFRFIEVLRADPQWKDTHSVNFNPRGILITSRTSFSRGLFMSQDPRGQSFHCPFNYMEKRTGKNIICTNKTKGT